MIALSNQRSGEILLLNFGHYTRYILIIWVTVQRNTLETLESCHLLQIQTINIYRIVASRSTSRLVTCLGLFRLLMKGIFGPYVLWPMDKKLIFWIVTRVSARDYTICCLFVKFGIGALSRCQFFQFAFPVLPTSKQTIQLKSKMFFMKSIQNFSKFKHFFVCAIMKWDIHLWRANVWKGFHQASIENLLN